MKDRQRDPQAKSCCARDNGRASLVKYAMRWKSHFNGPAVALRRLNAVSDIPPENDGKIIYEGELGIVIGKTCFNITEAQAGDYIFGYTCVNDVTAVELLKRILLSSSGRAVRALTLSVFSAR